MKLITVFTPTYNRASTLKRCYNSLIKQTSKNFLWQIIDDGSTDNTEKIVEQFISDNKLQIIYVKKENGGKASAINKSLEITTTDLWVCLDSDDYFFDTAIETYEKHYQLVKDSDVICGLFSLRSTREGSPMRGIDIPEDVTYDTQFNIRYKLKIEPEYVQVYKTKIISMYRYPQFDGEKYVPLSYVQDQIDQDYKFLIFHEPTMVCEYRDDGITKNQKMLIKRNPKGYTAFKKQHIEIASDLLFKIKACITYDTGCILSRNFKSIFIESPSRILTTIFAPIGLLDYFLRYMTCN